MSELQTKIKEWLKLDNEIIFLNVEMREKRENRKAINDEILRHLTKTNTPKIHVKLSDGYITNTTSKSYDVLTYGLLKKSFLEYFDGDESQTNELLQFIKSKREFQTVSELKRIKTK
jgi:hypothetical protein